MTHEQTSKQKHKNYVSHTMCSYFFGAKSTRINDKTIIIRYLSFVRHNAPYRYGWKKKCVHHWKMCSTASQLLTIDICRYHWIVYIITMQWRSRNKEIKDHAWIRYHSHILVSDLYTTYFAIWSNLFASFIVINQKFQSITFVKTAFVGYWIHQNESISPSDIWF